MSTDDSAVITPAATRFHCVGSVAALRGGQPISASVDGRTIAIFAVDDGVVATSGTCPHAGGPLHEGEVDGKVLTCPWHGWTFNLESGVCEDDPCMKLERYAVRIEGDDILVGL
ncbi:MAG TPA: Rieske (2Fe-2S) protein [Methylibium sp.]|nr:Rieske (2Fe-2S) protein [Methylibium sp.]